MTFLEIYFLKYCLDPRVHPILEGHKIICAFQQVGARLGRIEVPRKLNCNYSRRKNR